MRELNNVEVKEVSGAGIISDFASSIGSSIGSLADSVTEIINKTTDFKTAGSRLAQGIGQILELNFSDALSNINAGVSGIVSEIKSILTGSAGSSDSTAS